MTSARGFTLVELIVAIGVMTVIMVSVVEMFQFGIRRWDIQSSHAYAVTTVNSALEKIAKDARNAVSFRTMAAGSNTLYVFTLPLDTDSAGNYLPEIVGGSFTYVNGQQVAYYVSDISGTQTVTNGTVLWRATAPAGSSTFTPDTQWSRVNTTVARCSGIQSFSISETGLPSNAVVMTLNVDQTSGHQSRSDTISHEMYLGNHN